MIGTTTREDVRNLYLDLLNLWVFNVAKWNLRHDNHDRPWLRQRLMKWFKFITWVSLSFQPLNSIFWNLTITRTIDLRDDHRPWYFFWSLLVTLIFRSSLVLHTGSFSQNQPRILKRVTVRDASRELLFIIINFRLFSHFPIYAKIFLHNQQTH